MVVMIQAGCWFSKKLIWVSRSESWNTLVITKVRAERKMQSETLSAAAAQSCWTMTQELDMTDTLVIIMEASLQCCGEADLSVRAGPHWSNAASPARVTTYVFTSTTHYSRTHCQCFSTFSFMNNICNNNSKTGGFNHLYCKCFKHTFCEQAQKFQVCWKVLFDHHLHFNCAEYIWSPCETLWCDYALVRYWAQQQESSHNTKWDSPYIKTHHFLFKWCKLTTHLFLRVTVRLWENDCIHVFTLACMQLDQCSLCFLFERLIIAQL